MCRAESGRRVEADRFGSKADGFRVRCSPRLGVVSSACHCHCWLLLLPPVSRSVKVVLLRYKLAAADDVAVWI